MRIIRKTVVTIAIFIIIASVILNSIYFIINILPNKNKLFSAVATKLLHQPVQIKQAEIGGYWWEPVIVLHDATVGRVHLRELQMSLDLWKMITQQKHDEVKIFLQSKHVDIAQWMPWLSPFPELKKMAPVQALLNVKLWITLDQGQWQKIQSQFSARNVSVGDFKINSFSGELTATPTQGTLLLSEKNAQIVLPILPYEKLSPATLFAKINWIKDLHEKSGWRIEAESFKFHNAQWNLFSQWVSHINLQRKPVIVMSGNISINDTQFHSIEGSLSNTVRPVLSLRGKMRASLSSLLMTQKIMDIEGTGKVLCDFNVTIPLLGKQKMVVHKATIQFLNNDIDFLPWNIGVTHLMGTLDWNQGRLNAKKLKALFFDTPLFIMIGGENNIQVMLQGDLNPALLSQKFNFHFLQSFTHNIPFYAEFRLPDFSSTHFSNIDISLGDLYFLNQHWSGLHAIAHFNDSAVTVKVDNHHVAGVITFSHKKESFIQAHFNYLFLQSPKNTDTNTNTTITSIINPAIIPRLTISIDDFRINNRADGSVHFRSEPIIDGIMIREMKINSPLLNFSAKGYWTLHHLKSLTLLSGNCSSADLGALLVQRHLSSRLKGGQFSSEFSLQWPGSPQQFSMQHSKGSVDIKIEKGRILQLDSDTESDLNVSRLLNLLSMETLSHVLTFDIKSIAKKGFPFDYLQGNFDLTQGALVTRDIEMNGALAKIKFDGKISLSDQSNDLNMIVYPKVSTTLMTLVGMTGGPVVGAAAWLANKMVSPVVGQLMQMDYHVSGTWNNPVIKRVN